MITSFKLLLKNPTQVSPLHSCHLKYDLPVTVLVSGIWWWSCSYLTFRTPEFLFLMEPDGNYTFHHPSLAVVVWMYYSQTWHSRWKFGAWNWCSLQGKDLGTNHLPAKINRSDSCPEISLDWIALLSVRANSWLVIPEPQKTWCTQTIMLDLEILTPGNGWKIPGIAQVQRKLQWTICWIATTSSTWGLHVKRFSITDHVKS